LYNLEYPYAFGLALNETDMIMYVTDRSNVVKFYDANDPDFGYLGNIPIVVDSNNRTAIGIEFYRDQQGNKYLYTGGRAHSTYHNYLVRTDITDVNDPCSVEHLVGAGVTSVAVDQQTGYVYVTTSNNHIEVYNNTAFPTDPCWTDANDISGPADIIVRGDVSYKPPLFILNKVDDISGAVLPDDVITYTINYNANGHSDTNVVITDYLSPKVDINDIGDANYNPAEHTYTWDIGSLSPNDSGYVTLKVKANEGAEPNGVITNYCEIESDLYCTTATEDTNVGSWQPDSEIVYVDSLSPCAPGTGMSWRFAYRDLQDALERAVSGNQIWVARGTYKPTVPSGTGATFNLLDDVPIYGGFAGYENSLAQRNWITNKTALDGMDELDYVVTASDVNATAIVDGFRIRNGTLSGIYTDNSSATIANCEITGNRDGVNCTSGSSVNIADCNIRGSSQYGIYCNTGEIHISNCTVKQNVDDGIKLSNCELVVHNCTIKDNNAIGVYTDGSSSGSITNNIISGNNDHGIYLNTSIEIEIKNNWIYENGAVNSGDGIYIPSANYLTPSTIRNNTIVDNNSYGIRAAWADYVAISNCIIWGNEDGQLDDCSATYSCISDCNDAGGDGNNICGDANDPNFVGPNNDNYHLSPNSPCIDKGNTALVTDQNETDIDSDPRVWDGDFNGTREVDIGADEVYYSPADFDSNNIVNFIDYAMFADFWDMATNPNDYNDLYDLKDNNFIDNNDLRAFCDEWLWEPAWTKNAEEMMQQMMRGGMGRGKGLPESLYEPSWAEQQAADDNTAGGSPADLEPEQIKELIEWIEAILVNEHVKKALGEDIWEEFAESTKRLLEALKKAL
jgi:parallel beta-helix repeat protein